MQIDLKTGLPSSLAGFLVGSSGWSLPLPQLLNGTPPPSYNGPALFAQPFGSAILGITDAVGELNYSMMVPAPPTLVGLPLRWQGCDLNGPAPTTMWLSNGLITNAGA